MNKFEGGPLKKETERDYRKILADEMFRPDQTEKDPLKLIIKLEAEGKLTAEEAEQARNDMAQQVEMHETGDKGE